MTDANEADWVSRFADEVIAEAERRAPGKPIVCASGLSPSGPIHLGNLREVMTPHLVADEIRRRGYDCEHLISWDDYDRFRKVPAGIDPSWAEHIGKPLTSVPAPPGSPYPNWAEHFKAAADRRAGRARRRVPRHQPDRAVHLGRVPRADPARDAGAGRHRRDPGPVPHQGQGRRRRPVKAARQPTRSWTPTPRRAGGRRGLRRGRRGRRHRRGRLLPVQAVLLGLRHGPDHRHRVRRRDDRADLHLRACGHAETVRLSRVQPAASWSGRSTGRCAGPTRASIFEPSGVDHSSPGSSFVVGGQIVGEIFGGSAADRPDVRLRRHQRHGQDVQLARAACRPRPTRWRSWRRRCCAGSTPAAGPNQSFKIAFDQEIQRLYDEWDALAAQGRRRHRRARPTPPRTRAPSARPPGRCRRRRVRLPYRTLASIVDITTGDAEQTLRILRDLDPDDPITSLDEARPRLDRAQHWVTTQVPAEQRTRVRDRARHRAARLARRRRARVAAAAARRAGRQLVAGRSDHARLRRTQGPGRACRWTRSRRRS